MLETAVLALLISVLSSAANRKLSKYLAVEVLI
jgi:hypothetical protein